MNADDKHESTETCYDNPEDKLNEVIENNTPDNLTWLYEITFPGLFDKLSKEKILEYINTDYIDFNVLLKAIKNTRKIQGYTEQEINIDIERISRINYPFWKSEEKNKTK